MKLIKLTVFVASVIALSQNAMAIGPMEKSEVRDGQIICLGSGPGPKERPSAAATRGDDERRQPANNKSAQ